MLDGIGAPCIFGDADIVIVRDSRYRIADNVFENAAEPDGIVDIWFFVRRQIDTFGVTATFNIKNTGV